MAPRLQHHSIIGQDLTMGRKTKALFARNKQVTRPCVDAVITISAEGATVANTRDITIQLKDAAGNNIDYAEMVELINFASSAMLDFTATGGSTGIQAGAAPAGKFIALVAKKIFRFISPVNGLIVTSYLDTGTDVSYLGVRLPNGNIIAGGVLTCA